MVIGVAEQALERGAVVGARYRIEETIAEGAMGLIYRVQHELLKKPLALKVLRASLAGDPEMEARFEREARLASILDHENVIRVFDFNFLSDGRPYMVMELLRGDTLTKRLKSAPLPLAEVLDLAGQLLRGIGHAHRHRMVHRDLKPDNIMLVDHEGRRVAKILDFGLAKLHEQGADDWGNLTQAGMVCGTPQYMAPEQVRSEHVDDRADLYACACILYEALTGKPPIAGSSTVELMTKRLVDRPEPMHLALHPSFDVVAIERAIMRTLEINPELRFQSAGELLEELTPHAMDHTMVTGDGDTQISVRRPAHLSDIPDFFDEQTPFANTLPGDTSRSEDRTSPGLNAVRVVQSKVKAPDKADLISDTTFMEKLSRVVSSGRPALERLLRAPPSPKLIAGIGGAVVVLSIALVALLLPSRGSEYALVEAEQALLAKDTAKARAHVQAVLEDDAQNATAYLLLGHIEYAAGRPREAARAYEHALNVEGLSAGDERFRANTRAMLRDHRAEGEEFLRRLSEQGPAESATFLAELAKTAPRRVHRQWAYEGLERLNATHLVGELEYIKTQLGWVKSSSCEVRRWYLERLASLDDPNALPVLKQELHRKRRGKRVNRCVEDLLASRIEKLEKSR